MTSGATGKKIASMKLRKDSNHGARGSLAQSIARSNSGLKMFITRKPSDDSGNKRHEHDFAEGFLDWALGSLADAQQILRLRPADRRSYGPGFRVRTAAGVAKWQTQRT